GGRRLRDSAEDESTGAHREGVARAASQRGTSTMKRQQTRMRAGVWLPPGSTVYLMKLSVDGQVTRESTGKRTEEEAILVRQERLAELRRGDSVPHEGRLTLADLKTLISENYDT